jgi:hypothetical protein
MYPSNSESWSATRTERVRVYSKRHCLDMDILILMAGTCHGRVRSRGAGDAAARSCAVKRSHASRARPATHFVSRVSSKGLTRRHISRGAARTATCVHRIRPGGAGLAGRGCACTCGPGWSQCEKRLKSRGSLGQMCLAAGAYHGLRQ